MRTLWCSATFSAYQPMDSNRTRMPKSLRWCTSSTLESSVDLSHSSHHFHSRLVYHRLLRNRRFPLQPNVCVVNSAISSRNRFCCVLMRNAWNGWGMSEIKSWTYKGKTDSVSGVPRTIRLIERFVGSGNMSKPMTMSAPNIRLTVATVSTQSNGLSVSLGVSNIDG